MFVKCNMTMELGEPLKDVKPTSVSCHAFHFGHLVFHISELGHVI